MMTDRQRVEAGIIPALVYGICYNLKDQQETDEQRQTHARIVNAAFQAMVEPGEDLMPQKAGQIYRRSERTYLALTNVLDGASNAQAMMSTYYLTEELIQEGRISIYEDSDFGKAMLVYMEALDPYWDKTKLDAAAQKRARQMRETLRKEGYFR